ncbi:MULTISPECIES: ATP-binding protein [unclassified Kaistella]|uniref:DNA polymerase III subunit n=1 Tax=unclassified Kaistella TaxID=2762626 RepID=UPI00273380CF|nr:MULTISPECIES: DNA polymerase III subunit [unclassified Kaistella]MDP2454000.1 DNA polymerase III subunit [Kaistella sp. SH11-4b]MDP2457057.1 DNA polymerase III subunit [Kaistella sp. SH40-3]MDP2459814.1 DNA polymerase III subunit [Kaistella sp. SH19-2b]
MNWEQIVGHEELKNLLKDSIKSNRVSHAQLFVGKDGYGTLPLAMAFAKEILRKENEHSSAKVDSLNHLDLHFSFPVFKVNRTALSSLFFDEFRTMMLENPYSNNEDWSAILESENKQLSIYVEEIDEINKKFALKSFEGGSKILIVWQADKMNSDAANKFLKFLEEPPKNTYIILTASNIDFMLPTILSRTQIVEIPRIKEDDLSQFLMNNKQISSDNQNKIIFQAQGNWNTAKKLLQSENMDSEFEEQFIMWVREAFQVKKKPEFLKNIVLWGRRIATWNKEKQLNFLEYCAEMFRLALLQNYGNESLVYKKIESGSFKWDSFSKFIHGANIEAILEEISNADYHLERNGNTKIIWTDLGIKLSRYLHKKP